MSRTDLPPERGVILPAGHTGSSLFHSVLLDAVATFPQALGACALPAQPGVFKREYGSALPRFEAERVAAPDRVAIARFMLRKTQAALLYHDERGTRPLSQRLLEPVATPEIQRTELGAEPSLRAQVPFEGRMYRGREIISLAERLTEQQHMTLAARDALRFIVEHIEAQGGVLDLRGQCFAQLGAGAELATTRMLLQAGATVLWVDLADPSRALSPASDSGVLLHAPAAINLLQAPAEIAAAIERCAEQHGPVHLGLFAYASGASREWRLGASMNAVVSRLAPASVRSVSLLVSPTTTSTWQSESVRAAHESLRDASAWKVALNRAGLLPTPGYHEAHGVHIGRSTVSIQGLSYQAAQYVSKLAAAETYAVHGNDLEAARASALTVSANVAPITRTRSLAHPLFQAAFIGAPRFGVRIFDPETTRALSGLLILHDLLNPDAPGAAAVQPADTRDKAARLFSQQVHGGLYALPYTLEHAIRVAAVIGMGSRPSVLLGRRPSAVPVPV